MPESNVIKVQCTQCGSVYRVPERFAGKKIRCKKCEAAISVGDGEATASAGKSKPATENVPSESRGNGASGKGKSNRAQQEMSVFPTFDEIENPSNEHGRNLMIISAGVMLIVAASLLGALHPIAMVTGGLLVLGALFAFYEGVRAYTTFVIPEVYDSPLYRERDGKDVVHTLVTTRSVVGTYQLPKSLLVRMALKFFPARRYLSPPQRALAYVTGRAMLEVLVLLALIAVFAYFAVLGPVVMCAGLIVVVNAVVCLLAGRAIIAGRPHDSQVSEQRFSVSERVHPTDVYHHLRNNIFGRIGREHAKYVNQFGTDVPPEVGRDPQGVSFSSIISVETQPLVLKKQGHNYETAARIMEWGGCASIWVGTIVLQFVAFRTVFEPLLLCLVVGASYRVPVRVGYFLRNSFRFLSHLFWIELNGTCTTTQLANEFGIVEGKAQRETLFSSNIDVLAYATEVISEASLLETKYLGLEKVNGKQAEESSELSAEHTQDVFRAQRYPLQATVTPAVDEQLRFVLGEIVGYRDRREERDRDAASDTRTARTAALIENEQVRVEMDVRAEGAKLEHRMNERLMEKRVESMSPDEVNRLLGKQTELSLPTPAAPNSAVNTTKLVAAIAKQRAAAQLAEGQLLTGDACLAISRQLGASLESVIDLDREIASS